MLRRRAGPASYGGWLTGTATVVGSIAAVVALFDPSPAPEEPQRAGAERDPRVATYQAGVVAVCDFLAETRAAADRRHPDYAVAVTRAPDYDSQQAAVLREAQARVDTANELVDRAGALEAPRALSQRHEDLVAVLAGAADRYQELRDAIHRAGTYPALRAVFAGLSKSPYERDRRTSDGLLRRLGGSACRLPPDATPGIVRLRAPRDQRARDDRGSDPDAGPVANDPAQLSLLPSGRRGSDPDGTVPGNSDPGEDADPDAGQPQPAPPAPQEPDGDPDAVFPQPTPTATATPAPSDGEDR